MGPPVRPEFHVPWGSECGTGGAQLVPDGGRGASRQGFDPNAGRRSKGLSFGFNAKSTRESTIASPCSLLTSSLDPPSVQASGPSTAPSLSFPNNTQPEVQEVSMPPVKSEPVSSGPDESTSLAPLYPDEEQYEDYPEEEHYSEGHHSSGEVNKGSLSPEDLAQYIVSDAA